MTNPVMCVIYGDVDGVYTADPHICPEARLLPEISYEEMLEMASQGAKVVHPRAVELAQVNNIPILVTSLSNYPKGTLIKDPKLKLKLRWVVE